MKLPDCVTVAIPGWLKQYGQSIPSFFFCDQDAMAVAIGLASLNTQHRTGGPFGALLVDDTNGSLLAPGVNLVLSAQSSMLHAEVCAILLAQQKLGSHDVSDGGRRSITLYTTAEPCAMCLGAIPWSGIRRVVCGARDEDVRKVGFDEGDKPSDWMAAYTRRGIRVLRDVLREEACAVLNAYASAEGQLY